jgi:hypothetical protein
MGFMTDITILNDGWDQIAKNPKEFVEKMSSLMRGGYMDYDDPNRDSFGVGSYGNQVQVGGSHHADDPRLYLSHLNSLTPLNEHTLRNKLRANPIGFLRYTRKGLGRLK